MIKKIFTIETNPGRLGLTFTSPRRPTVRQRARRNPVAALLAAGWLAAIASAGAASAEQSVTLAWNPSPDASVVGYHVRAREENSTTNVSTDVGGRTKATLPGLKAGLRYTFTVTAYNQAGLESAPSNAAEFVAPVPLFLLPGVTPAALKRLQFPMAPGHWYELEASTDLKTWTTIWQTSVASTYAWTEFQDPLSSAGISTNPDSTNLKIRFYRLRIH